MNAAYQELLAKKAALEKQIEEVRAAEKVPAIAKVQELIRLYNLKPAEVFGPAELQGELFPAKRKQGVPKGTKFKPKYMDPKTGSTWSGRGKPPNWIKGVADRTSFLINKNEA
ncbi:DNA-binding protein H-NS [Burkholderia phage BCSR5]|nr:DNA-binding protein H-NS [Burkholderia phage BCSR5]